MKNRRDTMSGSLGSSEKKDWNWIQIDKLIWSLVQTWDGKDQSKEKIESEIANTFKWNNKQAKIACERHFRVYNRRKIK
jgi:hypothetical protein